MQRKILLSCIIFLLIFISGCNRGISDPGADIYWDLKLETDKIFEENIDVDKDNNTDYIIRLSSPDNRTGFYKGEETTQPHKYMTGRSFNVSVVQGDKVIGTVLLTLQSILDESCLYFIEYRVNASLPSLRLEIASPGMENDYSAEIAYYEKDALELKSSSYIESRQFDNTSVYIEGGDGSKGRYMRLGKVYNSRDLGCEVQQIKKENGDYDIYDDDGMVFGFTFMPRKDFTVRTEGILSVNPLVDWDDDLAFRTVKVMDLTDNKLIWTNGVYYPNMYNYIPRADDSFFRTPSALQIRSCYWVLDKGSLFRGHGLSMMYAYGEAYNDKSYIPTQPESEWLKEEYGIGRDFYDTRFNTDTVMALMNIYTKYQDEEILKKIGDYFDFFFKFWDENSFSVGEDTSYIPDYMDYNGNAQKPHSSLNHMVAEMTALYQYYMINHDETILHRAHLLLKTITSNYSGWIRDNGDLWYGINQEGQFIRDDYPLVTYNDLSYSMYFLNEVDGSIPEEYEKIFKSKKEWAVKNGYVKE